MDDDVDHVLFQHAQVGLGVVGHGGAEEDVAEFGAGHGAAPAVGQAGAQALAHQGFRVGGVAHVGHVHGGGDLPVHGAGGDAFPLPDLLPLLGGAGEEALEAIGLAVFVQSGLAHLMRDLVDVAAFRLEAPFLGQTQQLVHIGDLVAPVGLCGQHGVADLAAVVGVGGAAACGEAEIVAAGDGARVGAADAPGGFRRDAAGAHGADPAANTAFTETTLGSLGLFAVLPGLGAGGLRHLAELFQLSFQAFVEGVLSQIHSAKFLLISMMFSDSR